MCTPFGLVFGVTHLSPKLIKGKKILDVGSQHINGSIRPIFESWKPAKYVGVDIVKSEYVDVVCDANDLVKKFGPNSFDVVIAAELMEHIRDWRNVISNLKNVVKPGGYILLTTRSFGYAYHSCPYDFWRYEVSDMKKIFSDFKIIKIDQDRPAAPGVFVLAQKPKKFKEKKLDKHKLYSITQGKKVLEIDEPILQEFLKKYETRKFYERRAYKWVSRVCNSIWGTASSF